MQLFIFISTVFSLTLIIGFSFSLVYQSCKFFNFGMAIVITFAPYFTYLLLNVLQYHIFISAFLAIICATIVGILSEITLYKPFRKYNVSHVTSMLASLGLYIVLQNVISLFWGDRAISIRTGKIKAGHEFFGAIITNIQIITIVVSLLLFTVCVFFMKYNRIGRNIMTVASNPELSNVIGISSKRAILWATGISSVLFSVVGILIAFDTDLTPTMGFNWLLYGVVAMIIGGVGSYWGLLGGAALLVTTQYLVSYFFGNQWMNAVTYIILILFLIAKPLGFSGKRLKKVEI
jgi:branched-subunit amino acid ABC-type transport system permease component